MHNFGTGCDGIRYGVVGHFRACTLEVNTVIAVAAHSCTTSERGQYGLKKVQTEAHWGKGPRVVSAGSKAPADHGVHTLQHAMFHGTT